MEIILSYIALVLALKIAVSLAVICAPLLLAPGPRLAARTGLDERALPWLRLYGVAIAALVTAYASAFWTLADGRFPWGIVAMGVVSNAGGALAMIATGMARKSPLLTGFFGLMGAAFVVAALAPSLATAAAF